MLHMIMYMGYIVVEDEIKTEVATAINELKQLGVENHYVNWG